MPPLWVTLADDDSRQGADVGHLREMDARRRGRRHVNNRNVSPETSLRLNIVACRSELAAARCYGLPWSGFVDGDLRGLADIGGIIDVKSVENDHHCLIVPEPTDGKQKLEPFWIYMLVWAHYHPRYAIVGWRWGFEVAGYPISPRSQPGRPARFVPPTELHSPRDPQLLAVIGAAA